MTLKSFHIAEYIQTCNGYCNFITSPIFAIGHVSDLSPSLLPNPLCLSLSLSQPCANNYNFYKAFVDLDIDYFKYLINSRITRLISRKLSKKHLYV